MLGYIHIMPIGIDVNHVITAVNDRKFKPIQKIYLLHSPDDPTTKQPLKTIAVKLKKDLERMNHTVILKQIEAFKMRNMLDTIARIVKAESENVNSIKDIVVNVTGGTNMMAVASMWAAGANRISAYYVLDNRHNPNLESYLTEIDTPSYGRMLEIKLNHQEMLYILNKQTFHWDGISDSAEQNNISEDMSNSDWHDRQTRKGVTTLNDFKKVMKKHGVQPNTTRGRLIQMEDSSLVKIEHNVPRRSRRGSVEYSRDVYFIDQRAQLVSITDAGKSALIGYEYP